MFSFNLQPERWCILRFGIAYGLLAGTLWLWGAPGDRPLAAQATVPAAEGGLRFVGSASCGGGNCHGGVAPRPGSDSCRHHEWTYWLEIPDPHAAAYRSLEGERAGSMMAHLRPLGYAAEATAEERCLACHALPGLADSLTQDATLREWQRFGTGCESCHGPAGAWLNPHAGPVWKRIGAEDPRRAGFVPLATPSARAESCTGCHVGGPADPARGLPVRDVNHDMYAAGHPKLTFELNRYQRNLPPHWVEAESPSVSAGGWLAGQLAMLEGALRLTADRARSADRNDPRRPWPELAEGNCFTCHQGLASARTRGKVHHGAPAAPVSSGSAATGLPRWHQAGLLPFQSVAIRAARPGSADDFATQLSELHTLLAKPGSDPKQIAALALRLAAEVHALQLELDTKPIKVESIVDELRKAVPEGQPFDWEHAAHLLLATESLFPEGAPERELQRRIEPAAVFPERFDSPGAQDPVFHDGLKELQRALRDGP